MSGTRYLNAKNGIEILYEGKAVQILVGSGDPSQLGREASLGSIYFRSDDPGGTYFKYDVSDTSWDLATSASDTATISGILQDQIDDLHFLSLNDTPTTYSGHIGKYPRVNALGTDLEFDYIEFDTSTPEAPLIPETAVSGTYFVNFEAGRLLIGATGNKPDLVYLGPIGGLAFSDKAEEACYGSFKVPYSWHDETSINMRINFMVDDVQSGINTCVWKMDFHTYDDGETYYSKAISTVSIPCELPNNCAAGTFQTHDLIVPPNDSNNPISKGDIITFKFYRDPTDLSDDMVGRAVLITLMVEAQTGQHILGDS